MNYWHPLQLFYNEFKGELKLNEYGINLDSKAVDELKEAIGGGGGEVNPEDIATVVPPANLLAVVSNHSFNVESFLASIQKRGSTDYHTYLDVARCYDQSTYKGSSFLRLADAASGQYTLEVFGQTILTSDLFNYESMRNFLVSNKEAIESVTITLPSTYDENLDAYCTPQVVSLSTTYSGTRYDDDRWVFSFAEVRSWFTHSA